MDTVHRRPDGSIDCDFYIQQSRAYRAQYMDEALSIARLRALSPPAKRHIRTFVAAFALATGMFWATMLSSPPESQAESGSPNVSIIDLHRSAAWDLPILEADAI